MKKGVYRNNEYMLMTRDGLHFVTVTKESDTSKASFKVGPISKARSIMAGKEIREAIEYERDAYIVLGYAEKLVHFVRRIPG